MRRSCTASRFSRRYFAPFLFWFLFVRRANVSFTWRATSSSLTSIGFGWRFLFLLRFFPPPCWFPPLLPPPLLLLLLLLPLFFFFLPPCCVEAASMSTLSLLIRTRFFFSPLCCCIFSSRSFLRSSFDFFFGRVLWLRASRSIFPKTLTFGASFFSLLRVNILLSVLLAVLA